MTKSSGERSIQIEDDYIMSELSKSNLTSSIHGKLCQKSPIPSTCSIFRVPDRLRRKEEKKYEPEIVSIGPFHHGKKKLQAMEKIKLWYLHCLLHQAPTRETTLECFIQAIGSIEQECRACYAGEIDHFVEYEFIEMMVVDGCFVIEFFRNFLANERRTSEDPIFNMSWMAWEITNDLFLLENQLPWHVLDCLFNLTNTNAKGIRSLPDLLNLFPLYTLRTLDDPQIQYKHLLDCLHHTFAVTLKTTQACHPSYSFVSSIPSVAELVQAGVKFKIKDELDSLNITFKDGVIAIPSIKVSEITISHTGNLIAFEHCDPSKDHKITSYIRLLKDLINTSKDVDFLKQRKILQMYLSSEDIASFFNRVYNDAYDYSFIYFDLYNEVNAYCKRPCNKWKAILKHEYFSNPWRGSSVIAAILILGFTFFQTLCTILPYHQHTC